jgi:CD36 family
LFFQNLALTNNTKALEWWMNPQVDTLMKVHVFNYTNVDAFLNKIDDQLEVEDLGPFVYRETTQKVDVVFNPNKTITYKVSSAILTSNPNTKSKVLSPVV